MNYQMIKTYREEVLAGVGLDDFQKHFSEMYQKYHRAKPSDPDIEYAEASAMFGMAICDHPEFLKTLKRRLAL